MRQSGHILVLQHIWDDPMGYVGELLQEDDIPCDVVNVEAEPLPDPTPYQALIVFGGPQQANDDDKYPYFVQEKALIRQVIAQDIPFLGICLGGQLLAHALGATVKQHTMTEIGFFEVQLTEAGKADPLYAGLPGYQTVYQWHEDVFDIPQGAVQLATSGNTENQAFRYGHRAYGLQYHIELNPEMLNTWLHRPEFKQNIIDTVGIDRYEAIQHERVLYYERYRAHTRILIKNFLNISGLIGEDFRNMEKLIPF